MEPESVVTSFRNFTFLPMVEAEGISAVVDRRMPNDGERDEMEESR